MEKPSLRASSRLTRPRSPSSLRNLYGRRVKGQDAGHLRGRWGQHENLLRPSRQRPAHRVLLQAWKRPRFRYLQAGEAVAEIEDGPSHARTLMPGTFAVCQARAGAAVPAWATATSFSSITRRGVVHRLLAIGSSLMASDARRTACFRVAGPIPPTTVGVLASLVLPLAEAGISVFRHFDLRYRLSHGESGGFALRAIDALVQRGREVRWANPTLLVRQSNQFFANARAKPRRL